MRFKRSAIDKVQIRFARHNTALTGNRLDIITTAVVNFANRILGKREGVGELDFQIDFFFSTSKFYLTTLDSLKVK